MVRVTRLYPSVNGEKTMRPCKQYSNKGGSCLETERRDPRETRSQIKIRPLQRQITGDWRFHGPLCFAVNSLRKWPFVALTSHQALQQSVTILSHRCVQIEHSLVGHCSGDHPPLFLSHDVPHRQIANRGDNGAVSSGKVTPSACSNEPGFSHNCLSAENSESPLETPLGHVYVVKS